MISNQIKAIFLDVGNTLRILLKDEDHRRLARQELVRLTETKADPEEFCEELDRRYKVYRKWAFENLIEASEQDLWTKWLTPDYPEERIIPIVLELTYQFRQSMGRRVNAEGGLDVVKELHRRGYTLGIISNVITTREIPDWLEADGFKPYFKSVILSSVLGKRKPHPEMYLEAARIAGVETHECAYVGDNFARDVEGTREAGFGMVIIIPEEAERDAIVPKEQQPDAIINKLNDLLTIFPDRND